MRSTQITYAAHVAELRSYSMVPMDYNTWKMWYDYDIKKGFPP